MQRNELLHQIEILDGTRINLKKKLTELRIRRKTVYDQWRYYSDLNNRVYSHMMTGEELEKCIDKLAIELDVLKRRIKSILRDIEEIEFELDELRYKARTRFFEYSAFYIPNEESEHDLIYRYYERGTYLD